jgi:hypothetical protein
MRALPRVRHVADYDDITRALPPDLDAFSAAGSTDLSVTHHGGFNNDEYGILNIPVINGVFARRIGADVWQRTAASDTNIFYPDIGLCSWPPFSCSE